MPLQTSAVALAPLFEGVLVEKRSKSHQSKGILQSRQAAVWTQNSNPVSAPPDTLAR